ncbi:hypothetical protein [Kitasatospora sp. NPDC006786]|uniref:hypothetical protein n=1 Tax=unclassified Kitasatospora TaxID=2633591 RepID=UPI003388A6DC
MAVWFWQGRPALPTVTPYSLEETIMRALKRVLAVSALTVPLVIGAAGLASAHGSIDANYGKGFFTANENGAGLAAVESHVGPDGVEHADFWIWADDNGVTGSFTGSGATAHEG